MKVYLEVGNSCFCKCPMCDIHLKPHDKISLEVIKQRVDILSTAHVTDIRLAGNDPLTHPDIVKIINYIESKRINVDITTSLLSPSTKVIDRLSSISTLRVSLSTVREYSAFYGVDKFDLFTKNFNAVCMSRISPFNINYTFVEKFRNWQPLDCTTLQNFLYQFPTFTGVVNMFPEIKYTSTWSSIDMYEISQFANSLPAAHEFFGFCLKKITSCTVNKKHMYIDSFGNAYPCCMAGGEIGQKKVARVTIGKYP